MSDEKYDLGLATDGDAYRIIVIDEGRNYVHNNELQLLYWNLHEVKGQRGGVVRNLAPTKLLDRLAASFGKKRVETPAGFKWIDAGIAENNALLLGKSSGRLTIRCHISGKDGIFISALIIEMLSKTGKHISELQEMVGKITGWMYTMEDNLAATADMRILMLQRLKALIAPNQPPYPIVRVRQDDGTKLYFEGGDWVLLRFSSNEPVLCLFSPEKARGLADWLAQCAR